ncbi:ribonuclease HII [Bacillus mexicanus]|uniref:ribonuclease HII n=1 Tax=Bacillus mexicanus TaxID=2834415 RepID=UPI003D255880
MKNLDIENSLRIKGFKNIACIDECGRGPFAGDVVAAAVIMPGDVQIEYLTDSKALSKVKMAKLEPEIKNVAIDYSIGIATVEEIDVLNIKQATRLAMKRAVEGLNTKPDYLLIDGQEVIDLPIEQESIIKGDLKCHGISAASVLGKMFRDNKMKELDKEYDGVYGWARNAGYINNKHIEACVKYGLTKHHRKSWSTYQKVLDEIKNKAN